MFTYETFDKRNSRTLIYFWLYEIFNYIADEFEPIASTQYKSDDAGEEITANYNLYTYPKTGVGLQMIWYDY